MTQRPTDTVRPRLLDLFCGAGGAAMGYYRAGFDIIGVDIDPQPNYPFPFDRRDAMELLALDLRWLDHFALVHASPPCQRYSVSSKNWNGRAEDHPDLIAPVRDALRAWGGPYIIENVVGAPLLDPVTLCGVSFPGLRVIRHRLFESNLPLADRPHRKHPLVYTRDKRKAHYGKLDEWTAFVSVNGGGNCSRAAAADAMGIDWPMTKQELNEAIPPAYTEFLGAQALAQVGEAA